MTAMFDAESDPFRVAEGAALEIQSRAGGGSHDVAVVLGSGWAEASIGLGEVDNQMLTSEIAGFAASTVEGHRGTIHSMWVGSRRVLLFLGRVHLYEGHDPTTVVHAVRSAIMAGCGTVILTNAAGSINPDNGVGSGVLISDHINLTGRSPLTGELPPEPYASRFVDLTDLYTPRLRELARQVDPSLAEGVYAALGGPHFETPAEIRMLRTLGADLAGMSTALEAIAARHLGADVLGLSLVTNLAAGVSGEPLDHQEVLDAGKEAGPRMISVIRQLIERL
ncbi:MAG: purine-nucleoside phosphorylase [Acidimicrobiales bacterium]|nr:purine-nucleoside phosphorylase [Acidimicrobiales bacterium]